MDTVLVAKVLGVYFMVSGAFVVLQRRTLTRYLHDLFANRAVTVILGLVLFLGGTTLVLASDRRTPLVIEVISWAILLKGAAYIFAPEWLHGFVRKVSMQSYYLLGLLVAAVGVYLYFFL